MQFFKDEHIQCQKVPPYVHRANASERAIQTFKYHFISGLCSSHSNFPMHLWCRLLKQAQHTLNMMRASNFSPNISAHQMLEGAYNFMTTPMAPPGSPVLVHHKPSQRKTWGPHAMDGWYIAPALNHYRCFEVNITKTGSTRASDTVEFLPHPINNIFINQRHFLTDAAITLQHAMQPPINSTNLTDYNEEQLEALQQLATVFKRASLSKVFNPSHPSGRRVQAKIQRVPKPPSAPTRLQPDRKVKYKDTYCNSVLCPKTGNALEYKQLITTTDADVWKKSYANELGRLANGLPQNNIKGTNTISFMPFKYVPQHKRVTYGRLVVNVKPHKEEKYRTRLTVGGNLLTYDEDKSTPTADLSTIKILFNSVMSTPGEKFLTTDIKFLFKHHLTIIRIYEASSQVHSPNHC